MTLVPRGAALVFRALASRAALASRGALASCAALASLGTPSLLGCGGDDVVSVSEPNAPASGTEPLYAVETLVFGDQGSFSYVNLLPSLETQDTVRFATAREFAAFAPADPVAGDIVVVDGEAPQLTRFAVSDHAEWTQGGSLSFAQYSSTALDTPIYVSPEQAYTAFEATNFAIWNPAELTLTGEIPSPEGMPRTRGTTSELSVARGYSHTLRGDTLFQPYYWADVAFELYSELSQISVIDTQANRVQALLDVPCPHLHITSEDEDGNVYFSNGQGSIASAVVLPAEPKNCFVRVNAGEEQIDPTSLVHFADLTDGREASNLFYVRNGLALFSVYHAERDAADIDMDGIGVSANYHLWTLDLASGQAEMMEGVDFGGGQFVSFRIDERVFVAIPSGDFSSTAVYEVLDTGRAEKRFDTEGWAFKMFRVR